MDFMKQFKNTDTSERLDFAIIGAGIAGLTLAHKMHSMGYCVRVYEKARGTGGRLSSKKILDQQQNDMAFDLGCSTIMGKSEAFMEQLKHWHQQGLVTPWLKDKRNNLHYVPNNRNSSLTRFLSEGIDCHFSTKIESIEQRIDQKNINNGSNYWKLTYKKEEKCIDVYANNIILATPSMQAYDLLPDSISFKSDIKKISLESQWVLALKINQVTDLTLDDLTLPNNDLIHSISIESNKPTRNFSISTHTLQIQATTEWSKKHINNDRAVVENEMIQTLEKIIGQPVQVIGRYLHRWLYSTVSKGLSTQQPYLWSQAGIGLIGDYFNCNEVDEPLSGIEASWHSAEQLALALCSGSNSYSINSGY